MFDGEIVILESGKFDGDYFDSLWFDDQDEDNNDEEIY